VLQLGCSLNIRTSLLDSKWTVRLLVILGLLVFLEDRGKGSAGTKIMLSLMGSFEGHCVLRG
jgi:hypothetical protein